MIRLSECCALAATLLVLLAVSSRPAHAQARLAFEETLHDFGVLEEGEIARHIFEFTNERSAAVSLTNVVVSCGCTTPEWTDSAVAPGERGRVIVAYNSDGRPGPFRRTVRVSTDGEPATQLLYIQGEVKARMLDPATAQGNVLLDNEIIQFGPVEAGHKMEVVVKPPFPVLRGAGEPPVHADAGWDCRPYFLVLTRKTSPNTRKRM